MRRSCFGMALVLLSAAARAEDAIDQPHLVLQTGGHTDAVFQVLFTPEGKEIITVSADKTVRRWDAVTGERLGVLRMPIGPGFEGELRTAALSPDGKTLAVGGIGYERGAKPLHPIYLIDLDAGRVAASLDQPHDLAALAFSHDGKLLASGCTGGLVTLWDAASGRRLRTLEGQKGTVWGLAFSPDDALLATASTDATAYVWSVRTGEKAAGPLQHEDGITSVAWKDDETFATGGNGAAAVHLWDRHGKLLHHFDKLRSGLADMNSLAFLPGGQELFYCWFGGGKVGGAVLNLARPEASRDGWTGEGYPIVRGAVSPDGKLAATSANTVPNNAVAVWTIRDGKQVRRLAGRGERPTGAGWGPNGRVVAWSNGYKTERLQYAFDLQELRFAARPDAKFGRAVRARDDLQLERPDPLTLEVKSKDATIATIKKSEIHCYTLLAGGRVAVAFLDSLALFDAHTGKLLRELNHTGRGRDLVPSPDDRYLLGAFSDQIIRIWDPEKDNPLLSLFVDGADWVAWTEEGYYAASPAGEKLMGWQVNNGLDQLGTFYPAAQFHKTFYRPDVISRVLAEGSVAKALEAADKANGTTTQAVDVARALPPRVLILTPAAGQLDNAAVEVKARAQSKDRIVMTMHVLLDGRPAPGAKAVTFPGARAGDAQEATWKVTLSGGEHHLVVLAETDASLGASPEVVVTCPAQAQQPLPSLYVLAIGINAYPGSLRLNWAVDDAAAVRKAFEVGGAPKPFGKVEAKVLLDKDASKEGILGGLDWLNTKMTADDTAVVFYAGHGHRDKKTGQFYMLPQDVDVGDLPKTGVTGTTIKEKLKAAPGKVLVLLDACHSGSIGQSPADPASLTDDVQRQLAAPDCGVVVMCAAMAQEEAGEAAAVKQGFFTAALLKGLGGEAPHDRKDGLIHLAALDFYVEEEVAELSKDEQHVVIDRPSTLTSFPLVKPPAKAEENNRK